MSFSIDINKWIKKANGNTELVVRKIGLELFVKVVQKSPVDTGRFRGNWIMSINAPNSSVDENRTDKQPYGSPPSSTIYVQADNTVRTWKLNDSAIYLANNLPYGYRLEFEGYSKQAPQGMARISVMEIASKYA